VAEQGRPHPTPSIDSYQPHALLPIIKSAYTTKKKRPMILEIDNCTADLSKGLSGASYAQVRGILP
jgi:hypothetical protein